MKSNDLRVEERFTSHHHWDTPLSRLLQIVHRYQNKIPLLHNESNWYIARTVYLYFYDYDYDYDTDYDTDYDDDTDDDTDSLILYPIHDKYSYVSTCWYTSILQYVVSYLWVRDDDSCRDVLPIDSYIK